jgi:hypothetical protein
MKYTSSRTIIYSSVLDHRLAGHQEVYEYTYFIIVINFLIIEEIEQLNVKNLLSCN